MSSRTKIHLGVAVGVIVLVSYHLFASNDAKVKPSTLEASGDSKRSGVPTYNILYPDQHTSSVHVDDKDLPFEYEKPPRLRETFVPLTEDEIAGVEKFVVFVGYARSGHSIIGSFLDAHPSIVIAHEFMIFRKWLSDSGDTIRNKSALFNELYRESFENSLSGLRMSGSDKKGYDLSVNNSWQGQFKQLKVVGDKSGGMTGIMYHQNSTQFRQAYHEIANTVRVPIYSLHIIRNPFDMISTQLLYQLAKLNGKFGRKYVEEGVAKASNVALLHSKVDHFFKHATAIQEMVKTCNLNILNVYSEKLIADPIATMQRICGFLEIQCTSEYLQMCLDKTFRNVSRTRDRVLWSVSAVAYVEKKMKEFPFLHGYSFRDDSV